MITFANENACRFWRQLRLEGDGAGERRRRRLCGESAALAEYLAGCSCCTRVVLVHVLNAALYVRRQIARRSAEYKGTYQRFVLKQKPYAQQFSHIYVSRLHQLRDVVARQVEQQQSEGEGESAAPVLPKIIDLREGEDAVVVIGTLLKVLDRKPDVFKELVSERGLTPIELADEPLASEDDQLLLEDESGRVELIGDVSVATLVTGVVLGVRGRMEDAGFRVDRVFLPSLPPQQELPTRPDSEYIALVSGLSVGSKQAALAPLHTHLLVDYLAGRIGDDQEKQFVSQIVRTVVVGNSIQSASQPSAADEGESASAHKKKTAQQLDAEAAPLRELDEILSSLASSMAVDVMPGATDPSSYTLPQQSLHPCLFPCSSRFASFRSVTNPYEAEIGGVSFLGHSGQPLSSVLQSTLLERRPSTEDGTDDETMGEDAVDEGARALDAMQRCLEWRHVAPTAPDLLACFPLANEDPFVLEVCPHVFFAGNQKAFATRMIDGTNKGQHVRLVSIPSFAETATIVLVDLKDLSCFPITIA